MVPPNWLTCITHWNEFMTRRGGDLDVRRAIRSAMRVYPYRFQGVWSIIPGMPTLLANRLFWSQSICDKVLIFKFLGDAYALSTGLKSV